MIRSSISGTGNPPLFALMSFSMAQSDQLPMMPIVARKPLKYFNAAFARIWTINEDQNLFLELQASAGMYTHLDSTYDQFP